MERDGDKTTKQFLRANGLAVVELDGVEGRRVLRECLRPMDERELWRDVTDTKAGLPRLDTAERRTVGYPTQWFEGAPRDGDDDELVDDLIAQMEEKLGVQLAEMGTAPAPMGHEGCPDPDPFDCGDWEDPFDDWDLRTLEGALGWLRALGYDLDEDALQYLSSWLEADGYGAGE